MYVEIQINSLVNLKLNASFGVSAIERYCRKRKLNEIRMVQAQKKTLTQTTDYKKTIREKF